MEVKKLQIEEETGTGGGRTQTGGRGEVRRRREREGGKGERRMRGELKNIKNKKKPDGYTLLVGDLQASLTCHLLHFLEVSTCDSDCRLYVKG